MWEEINRLKGKRKAKLYPNALKKAEELLKDFTTRGNAEFLPEEVRWTLEDRNEDRRLALERNIGYNAETDVEITFREIDNALDIHKKTAPGNDNLPYAMLTHTKSVFRLVLKRMFNLLWNKGLWPTCWKTAVIIPISKQSGEGLRPISLLTCLSKVYEKVNV